MHINLGIHCDAGEACISYHTLPFSSHTGWPTLQFLILVRFSIFSQEEPRSNERIFFFSTLRFISKNPPLTVYSADFKITTENYLLPAGLEVTNTTSSSTTAHASEPTAPTTVRANPLGSSTHANVGGSSSSSMKANWDGQATFRFRLFFVVWPALVGASMAI